MAFTGDQFVNITDKRILGYEDFGEYFLNHLRWAIEIVLSKVYTKSGTFGSSKIGLSSVSNDTFRLLANGEGVSSEGHLFEYYDSLTDYAFENANGQTYEVGFAYSEHPVALAINPRTGQPEFTRYEEYCGGETTGAGGPIIDNGTTLTIDVSGTVEPGVDNSGREVRVWKNIPGPNATSMSVAVETCTVQWGDLGYGNVNYVTTVAQFGQDTVETSLGEYSCQLLGPYVSRDSSIASNGYWFIGAITGNGPAATPTGFSDTNQNIIPFSLSESQDAANITVDDANWHQHYMADSDSGGIGTPYAQLQAALDAIDEALVRGRTAVTLADDTQRTIADYASSTAIAAVNVLANGGRFLLKKGSGTVGLVANTPSLGGASHLPEVIGDVKTGGVGGYSSVIFLNGGTVNTKLRGSFKRLELYSGDFNNAWEVPLDVNSADTIFEDCGIRSGNMRIFGNDCDERPVVFRHVEFDQSTSDGAFENVITMQRASTGYWPYVIFEHCVFKGPHSSAGSPGGVIYIDDFGVEADQYAALRSRRIVFKDCLIVHEEINAMPTIWVGDCSPQEVIFENCTIRGKAGQTSPVVHCEDSLVKMKNCSIYAPSGQALRFERCEGTIEDCFVIAGTDTTVTNPQFISASGRYASASHDRPRALTIRNLKVKSNSGCIRNGTTPTYPMIELGGHDNDYEGGPIHVDGLHIDTPQSGSLHDHSTLVLRGVQEHSYTYPEGKKCNSVFENIFVDCGRSADTPGTNAESDIIAFINEDETENGQAVVRGFSICNVAKPDGADTGYDVINSTGFDVENVFVGFNSHGSGSSYTFDNVIFFERGIFEKVKIIAKQISSTDQLYLDNAMIQIDNYGTLRDFDLQDAWGTDFSSASAYVYMTGVQSVCDGGRFPTGGGIDSTVYTIYATNEKHKIVNNVWNNWTEVPTVPFIYCRDTVGLNVVANNIIEARSGGAYYVDLGTSSDCPGCVMMGNVFYSSISGNPTTRNSSSDSVGGSGENVYRD